MNIYELTLKHGTEIKFHWPFLHPPSESDVTEMINLTKDSGGIILDWHEAILKELSDLAGWIVYCGNEAEEGRGGWGRYGWPGGEITVRKVMVQENKMQRPLDRYKKHAAAKS